MARYTGPKTKIARRFGEAIFGEDKSFEKRNPRGKPTALPPPRKSDKAGAQNQKSKKETQEIPEPRR